MTGSERESRTKNLPAVTGEKLDRIAAKRDPFRVAARSVIR
jgi:hypothetical protein